MIRGVNIGSWLVLEKWMVSDLSEGTNATDQYTFDSTLNAEGKLNVHWDSYFTEADVASIASWGINALRIPIGFWAYDNSETPYLIGADAYLEKAVGWARTHGLRVLIDCHGSPGSQNGFDNSGRAGNIRWQSSGNLDKSISILEVMAKKYGTVEYADVVLGLQLTNEPAYWGDNDFDTTKEWTRRAYHAVKAAATNPTLLVVMHDSFQGPAGWLDIGQDLNGNVTKEEASFAIDTHL
ncbi:Putative glycoside hydrolase, family 5, glycoside hydrolase superfamily [Septoria linicola]|uniref:glucan 1,3-beta-glucosidase n=1 Tax=Septoria linicola TaxID=215465 RepID=A0A9Q9ANV4_9PEZI|nr:Putative glycoside hydrolase, family 5, glycoside hydrolase superfamily [Septoria linicola]